MSAQISFFDMETSASNPDFLAPIPVTLGPNWQPNDIRVFCNLWFEIAITGGTTQQPVYSYGNRGLIPPGFTGFGPNSSAVSNEPYSGGGQYNNYDMFQIGWGAICWRRLLPGDTDTFVQPTLSVDHGPNAMNCFASALFTVRGVDPGTNPTMGGLTFQWDSLDGWTSTANSFSVPGAGAIAIWASCAGAITNSIAGSAANGQVLTFNAVSPTALGIPTGWTGLVATPNSGLTFFEYDTNPSSILIAKSFSGSGSSGSIAFPVNPAVPAWLNANYQGCRIFLTPAPTVSGTAGSASSVSSATAATAGGSTTVRGSTGSASATSSATTAFGGLDGYFVSDPLPLSGNPVIGTVVRWDADIPLQSSLVIETSINNGASWDTATNEGSVPRLHEGDTATRNVLVRATFSRQSTAVDSPTLNSLYLAVSTDAGVTELVPIGHGMIDKVTVHSMGGTTGSGSSTNVAGSTAVVSRGGGQTGGGTVLKIHANDLSYAIKRNVWQMPYTVSGMNYGDAIKAMVLDRLPDQTAFNIATTTRVCPLLVYGLQQGGDPMQDIMELAQAIGWEAFFDATGTFVARPVPDPRIGDPVWTFDEDDVLLVAEAERELSSDQTFNDIVVVGQSTSSQNPFSAESFDDDASSPTYILGPYGRVAQRLTFSQITSQDQAQATADTALLNSLGAADTVTLTVVPHPALEPGDIVRVNCSNVKANGTYMINSLTMPLSPADPMQITCFRQSTSI